MKRGRHYRDEWDVMLGDSVGDQAVGDGVRVEFGQFIIVDPTTSSQMRKVPEQRQPVLNRTANRVEDFDAVLLPE